MIVSKKLFLKTSERSVHMKLMYSRKLIVNFSSIAEIESSLKSEFSFCQIRQSTSFRKYKNNYLMINTNLKFFCLAIYILLGTVHMK